MKLRVCTIIFCIWKTKDRKKLIFQRLDIPLKIFITTFLSINLFLHIICCFFSIMIYKSMWHLIVINLLINFIAPTFLYLSAQKRNADFFICLYFSFRQSNFLRIKKKNIKKKMVLLRDMIKIKNKVNFLILNSNKID